MNTIKDEIRKILDTFTYEQFNHHTWYEIECKLCDYFHQALSFGLVTQYKISNENTYIHLFYDVGLGLSKNSIIYYGDDQVLHHSYEDDGEE